MCPYLNLSALLLLDVRDSICVFEIKHGYAALLFHISIQLWEKCSSVREGRRPCSADVFGGSIFFAYLIHPWKYFNIHNNRLSLKNEYYYFFLSFYGTILFIPLHTLHSWAWDGWFAAETTLFISRNMKHAAKSIQPNFSNWKDDI